MKKRNNITLYALLLLGAFFFLPKTGWCQDRKVIELLKGGDDISMDGKTGNWVIRGHVYLKKGTTKVYCDSAYYNVVRDYIKAFGRIHLNKQDTLNMYCDSLFFDVKKNFTKLYGNVRILDNEYKLTTDSIEYDLTKNVGIYRNNGLITSITSPDRLRSKIGYFYPNSDQFNFSDSVVYTNEEYTIHTDTLQFNGGSKMAYFYGPTNIQSDSMHIYCEKGWYDINNDLGVLQNNAFIERPDIYIGADSLYFSQKDSLYIARYNVHIKDSSNHLGFQGNFARNDGLAHVGYITGHALAKHFGKEDTLYIHADTLFNYLDSVNNPTIIKAYRDVKLFRGTMQGVCDSMIYNKKEGILNLYEQPILWAKQAQLSSDTITLFEKNSQIQRAFLRKQGLIISHVDSTNYYNQITGTDMNAYFDSTEIRSVEIDGNAKTIYFLEEKNETDTAIIITRKGMNRLYASSIRLGFENGDIVSATYRDHPDGVLYPMTHINKKEEKVETFKWKPERRPKSWQAMILSDKEKHTFLMIFHQLFEAIYTTLH